MNLSKSAFRRYKIIDSLLRNTMRKYPSMEEILDACERHLDYRPSIDTIQKDIYNMKLSYPDGFDAPIRFSRTHMGYEYSDPNYALSGVSLQQGEIDAISEAVDLIQAIGGSRIGTKFNHAMQKLLSATLEKKDVSTDSFPVVQTMLPPVSRGFEHFDLYYKACKERIPVSFIHFSYRNRLFKHIILHAFVIKEFENRWYIIGYSEQHKGIRTFGLDRISEPELIKMKYLPSDPEVIRDYLHDVYGVFPIPGRKKSKIKIHASALATHYFHAYPLHESQQIKKENSGDSFITYDLIPSIELSRYILSQGYHVEIISPKWFHEFTKELQS
jgi:predicted DNA-binding transcriptional regulator YafY